jgi:flagellar motor switch protein FliM
MSDHQLNPDEIAELVEAAKQGQLPEEAPAPRKKRTHRLRTVDFSRPTKFNSDHQRRIARAVDAFCHSAAQRMAAELRVPAEMDAINTVQLTWAVAQSQLPSSAVAMTVEVQPLGTRMLMVLEMSVALASIEHLLGGMTDGPVAERRLSEIDWALTRRLMDSFVQQFSPLWDDLAGIELTSGDIDLRTESSQIAAPSDPTLAVLVEVRVNRQSGMLGLLVPWDAIDPVGDRLSGKESPDEHRDPFEAAAVAQALSAAEVTVRAEVAATDMAVEEVLALGPGSLVRLGQRADAGACLFVEETPLRRAQPGRSGRRRAVKIQSEGAA